MRILFDQGVPVPLRAFLRGHEVMTAYEMGWATMKNGTLLQAAESLGFSCMVTTDKNLIYQQNLSSRKIALVVLPTTSWPRLKGMGEKILEAVGNCRENSYEEV